MSDTLDVSQVTLFVEQYTAAQMLDWPFAEPPKAYVDIRHLEHCTARVLLLIQQVAVQRECIARYPANWWEDVKARFAPAWFKRRYPVQERVIDMEVLYPKVAIPRLQHVVRLAEYKFDPEWPKAYTK